MGSNMDFTGEGKSTKGKGEERKEPKGLSQMEKIPPDFRENGSMVIISGSVSELVADSYRGSCKDVIDTRDKSEEPV
ncbi:hypothetical protein TURU_123395 [Turdus rufiventris]|nr:hypothetical protein TURU_123395 [Turdus rufiventris]